MRETLTGNAEAACAAGDSALPAVDELRRLREENARLREGLEGVLVILGNPQGYCDDDRTEVAHAVAEAERSLGRRAEPVWRRRQPSGATR